MNKILMIPAILVLLAQYVSASTFERVEYIDKKLPINQILFQHWQKNNIEQPPVVSDALFLRRAALTLMGRLPNAGEVQNFLSDSSKNKRSVWIDKFLNSQEYADMQAMRFADMLRIKSEFPINLWPNAVQLYHRTVRDDLKRDRSLKDMFYEMLTASGSNFRTAYANFFRASADRSPEGLAKMVLLTTMNMRDSAFSEAELKQFARLFSTIRYKSTYEWKEEIVYPAVEPAEFTALLPDGTKVEVDTARTDPRKVFADWLLNKDNDYFARAITNRVWNWVFGRGIYPVADDLPKYPDSWDRFWGINKTDNAPFSEELQNYLIKEFKQSNYSLRHLYKIIMNSASFHASPLNQDEVLLRNFAAYPVRRLESELVIDALSSVTGGFDRYMSVIPEPFTFLPWNTRAITIADGSISSGVLDNFGRPPRDSGQNSERNTASTDSQGLYLMNSTALYRRINNYYRNLQRRYRDENSMLNRIYLDILSRYPTARERQAFQKYKQSLDAKSRYLIWSDTIWVLFNSKEFLFYH